MIDYEKYKKGIEKLFYVVNKDNIAVPFKLRSEQDWVLRQLSDRHIILKSRQQGISSVLLAMFTLDFLMVENTKCVVISHEAGATQRLFDRVKYYLETVKRTFPGELPYELDIHSRNELRNKLNNATFYIGTAGAKAFGHGDTINNLHVTELSRWENQERTMVGLLQAVPKGGRVIIETTANGFGNYFYNLWVKNSQTNGAFKTVFVPWFITQEYRMPVTRDMEFADNSEYGDELAIMNKYHLEPEQMSWRRWKIDELNGNMDKFNESFPATAEEAFIVSGNPVWSPTMLKFLMLQTKDPQYTGNLMGFNPVTVEPNDRGFLKIYKKPNEFHKYVIGADVSEGKIVSEGEDSKETDFSCAQIIDQNTMEQVAVWHGKLEPDLYGRQLEMLGRYYNNALIAVERNAMGYAPLIVLRDLNYPNLYYREKFGLITEKTTNELGWLTDHSTKEMAISDATKLLREKRIMIYDGPTVMEMTSFVRGPNGQAGAISSAWDDRVMALLIAIQMLGKQSSSFRGNAIEQEGYADGSFQMDGVVFGSDGMPQSPGDSLDAGDVMF